MTAANALIVGTPALSRMRCKKCKEETLHKGLSCVHCSTEYALKPDSTDWKKRFTNQATKKAKYED